MVMKKSVKGGGRVGEMSYEQVVALRDTLPPESHTFE